MDISELQEEANTRLFNASVAAKCPSTDFLFLIIDKKKLQIRSFSHVEFTYDVAMRRNIPVNVLFTSLTKEQHAILIIKYCLAGCDIGSAFFGIGKKSVSKRMIQGALEFQGLKGLGYWLLSNCQSLLALSLLEQHMKN